MEVCTLTDGEPLAIKMATALPCCLPMPALGAKCHLLKMSHNGCQMIAGEKSKPIISAPNWPRKKTCWLWQCLLFGTWWAIQGKTLGLSQTLLFTPSLLKDQIRVVFPSDQVEYVSNSVSGDVYNVKSFQGKLPLSFSFYYKRQFNSRKVDQNTKW